VRKLSPENAAVQWLRWSEDDEDDDPRHLDTTTVAFLTVGAALLLSGSVLHGDTGRGIGLVAAGASTVCVPETRIRL
jgi:hypothetical protein